MHLSPAMPLPMNPNIKAIISKSLEGNYPPDLFSIKI